MPGMEMAAPDLTDTSSGLDSEPIWVLRPQGPEGSNSRTKLLPGGGFKLGESGFHLCVETLGPCLSLYTVPLQFNTTGNTAAANEARWSVRKKLECVFVKLTESRKTVLIISTRRKGAALCVITPFGMRCTLLR